MRNFTPVKAGSGGTGDYAEYLLKKEALKKSSEYYVEGETEATASVYIGSKSAKLGLSGEIDLESAKQLLAGVLPDGTQIRRNKTSGQEILAHDNTLSAPKSVSIQATEDIRVFECHVAAVRDTIAAVEKYYCVQRVQKDGIRTLEKGDGFVGWMTHHWQSREGDIDMHTHVMTMNGCMGPDDKWRAVEDHQMSKALWLGSYYRNCLGQRLQSVGYKIREKQLEGKGYSFELEGYTDQDIEKFSTRHEQIAEAKKKGLSDQEAWYTTRKDKDEEISLGELFEKTIAQKAEIGCTGQSFPMSMNLRPIGKTDAATIVDRAIAHLSRGSCRFSQADILAQAFDHIERVKLKDVEQVIATHPELVDYGVIRGIDELKGQYTTATTLERETRIIKRWMRGQGQAKPIMGMEASKDAIARLEVIYKIEWQQSHDLKLQELWAKITDGDISKRTAKKLQRLEKEAFKGLNKGQLGAVQGILATRNNNVIVYGLSGVGKTKSLRPTKDILSELGIDTVWLAPSLAAVEILTEDVGKQAYTLQRLAYTDSIKLEPGQLIFVDEFGLADAECMDLASAKAEAAGARLIGIGDPKQNQPIQAGSSMRSLMEHGAEVFKISEILRQQDPIQKRAVELIANGQGVDSIALLSEHGYVTEIQDPDQRQDAIAAQYLGLSVADQKNTLLITGTNAERLALTEKIRQGQKDAGVLGESLDCTQLVDSRLSPEQLTDLRNYAIGDYVAPVRDYAKVKRHEFCKVIGKTETHLILESPSGSTVELDPDRWDKKRYTASTINVAVGDELRLRGNIHEKDFQNGQVFTVKEIEGAIATLEGQKGKTRTIDLSRPVPIDHNIVRTAYDVQGSGKEGAILSLTDDRTSNQGSTYVGISRQFLFLTIYTQNYDALLKRVARECTHDNALDLLKEFNHDNNSTSSGTTGERFGAAGENTLRAGVRGLAGEPSDLRRDDAENRRVASRNGRPDQEIAEASGGQERHLFVGGAIGTNGGGRYRDSEYPDRAVDSPGGFDTGTRGLQELADEIVRIRLQQELAEPLARLQARLSELRELKLAKEQLQADNAETLQQVLAWAKVEVLSTTLKDWRSLKEENAVQRLTQEVSDSDRAQLTELLENYPAQKAIQYAVAEYSSVRDQGIDLNTSLKERTSVFTLDELRADRLGDQSNEGNPFEPETIERTKNQSPVAFESVNNIADVTKPEKRFMRVKPPSILPKPVKPNPPFWIPDYSQSAAPNRFTEKHWAEATESAIDPRLVATNMRPASGDWVTQRLAETVLNDPKVSQTSKDNLKAKYAPVVQGGIWFNAGYDIEALAAANAGDRIPETSWGVYKSFTPRIDEKKTKRKGELSFRKYENPIGQRREFFMPIVSPDMADEMYRKHGINPTAAERESGLYFVALKYNLPIVITEGAKKTMASLSQGHITIGMQGVNALYRARDDQGERLPERQFNESFACWATPGRKITFAFDADIKQSSIVAVRRALVHSVELLQQRGCEIKVAAWRPEEGKGLDDLIVQSGPGAYEKALLMAQPPDAAIAAHYRYEYERVNSKLGEFATDEAIRAEMRATNPQDTDRVLAQSDTVKASLQWLDLILAKYGEEEEDEIVLGNWRFSKEGNSLIVKGRDGTVGLCVTGGSITNHAQWNEISRQIQSAVAAMTVHPPTKMSGAGK
jgi:conjugative relaxase-like TrwC/TraI family protein